MNQDDSWKAYYQKMAKRPPRELFVHLMKAWAEENLPPGFAIDLGCGDGTETFALLEAGWSVLAVDQSPDAIRLVEDGAPPALRSRLQTQQAAFDLADLPPADLIYAGLSLPFCPPAQFPEVWQKVRQALKPGGYLAAHFFGVRDSWASNPQMTFHDADQMKALLADLQIKQWKEAEEDRSSAFEAMKHFHYFEIIARESRPF